MYEKKNASDKEPSSSTGTLGLKAFNQVGREDTTTEVLRPQRDPGANLRIAVGIVVAVLALSIIGYISFSRSGLSLFPKEDGNGRQFGPGAEIVRPDGN